MFSLPNVFDTTSLTYINISGNAGKRILNMKGTLRERNTVDVVCKIKRHDL